MLWLELLIHCATTAQWLLHNDILHDSEALNNKLHLNELSTLCCKTSLMLPEEQTPDWYTMSSKPVFATSIPMILKWTKNTKSTKTSSLIDYLWEQQAILKRKRIKLKTYESILTWKLSFTTWKSSGWMMTSPNSSGHFQTSFTAAASAPISCTMFTYFKFACSANFWKYRRYLTIMDVSVTFAGIGGQWSS